MSYFIPFLSAVIISAVLVGVVRRISEKYGIMFSPRTRDVHKKPVSRLGGVGIFIAFFIVALASYLILNLEFPGRHLFGLDLKFASIIAAGFLITAVMAIDDVRGLRPSVKLLIQIIAALFIIAGGIGIDHLSNPFGNPINLNSVYIPILTLNGITYHFSLWSDLLTLIWIVGMMNVINFIDGVDGLAGGVSGIAAFTIFLLSITVAVNQPATATIAIILAGSCLGFLFWNFPPAKIFMGDSGSMFLGFMLGVLPLISGGKLATVFLVLGFPIIDGLFVAVGRILRKQNPLTTPDKTHLHHRFLSAGFSTRQAILIIYVVAAAFAWVALRSTTERKLEAAGILIILLVIVIQLLRAKALNSKS